MCPELVECNAGGSTLTKKSSRLRGLLITLEIKEAVSPKDKALKKAICGDLLVVGNAPSTTNIAVSTVAGGWTLVGYPSVTNRVLPGALSDHGVLDDFTLEYAYHPVDTADPSKLYDITTPSFVNDLTFLSTDWGYWVKVTADHTWHVVYLAP